MIDKIFFHVTKRCNLKCRYCYINATFDGDDEITLVSAKNLLNDVISISPQKIVFTGGEPLFREDIFDMVNEFRNSAKKHNIIMVLSTNGTLITDKNAEIILDNFDEVRISIDGKKEINDHFRGVGTFENIIKAIDLLRQKNCEPIIGITVTRNNYNELKSFFHYLISEKQINKISLNILRPLGRANDDYNKLACSLYDADKALSEFLIEYFGCLGAVDKKLEKNNSFKNCGVGSYLNIYPDGSVYPCHMLSYSEFCLGNINEASLISIINDSNHLVKLSKFDANSLNLDNNSLVRAIRDDFCLGMVCDSLSNRESILRYLNE